MSTSNIPTTPTDRNAELAACPGAPTEPPKRRGRPPLTPEQRAERAAERAAADRTRRRSGDDKPVTPDELAAARELLTLALQQLEELGREAGLTLALLRNGEPATGAWVYLGGAAQVRPRCLSRLWTGARPERRALAGVLAWVENLSRRA